jgi:hypothetical protein
MYRTNAYVPEVQKPEPWKFQMPENLGERIAAWIMFFWLIGFSSLCTGGLLHVLSGSPAHDPWYVNGFVYMSGIGFVMCLFPAIPGCLYLNCILLRKFYRVILGIENLN